MIPFRQPGDFPRRVLVSVCGLTPQVVTETLFALAQHTQPPFVPTEVHLVTTREGARRVQLLLLNPADGALRGLAAEWGLPELPAAFDGGGIHVVADGEGRQLDDIVEPHDHLAAADVLTGLLRDLASDPEAALHVSIAGGRKTLGFLAGYVLSLFARPQDRLSHVLVVPELEQHPQFFYPPRQPRVLVGRSNQPVTADACAVRLAEIPFVRLREGLPAALLDGTAGYAETVRRVQTELREPELVVDVPGRRAIAHGRTLKLPPVQLAWLLLFARRRVALGEAAALNWRELEARDVLDAYTGLFGHEAGQLERLRRGLTGGASADFFNERKARHNNIVREALGRHAVTYSIVPVGRRPTTRYLLATPPRAISIIEHRD